jgi:hypothetical protein
MVIDFASIFNFVFDKDMNLENKRLWLGFQFYDTRHIVSVCVEVNMLIGYFNGEIEVTLL